ncbi:HAD family hydrolase [Streptosporangium sp. NPDC000509]|uniref:HAD family hydrolase n=1 Tax=Streptosporangium sp. NPDC000509 TaxID=3366186 RepID=UPI0036A43ED4
MDAYSGGMLGVAEPGNTRTRRGDLMPIQGVLFDVDDTLFDYSTSEEVGVLTHLRAEGLLERFPDSTTALALWRDVMERQYARFLNGELTFTEQQLERTREFLSHLGQITHAGLSDQEASAWFAGYQVHRRAAWAAFPDAEPVLKKLAPDYRLGVVSNSSADHQRHKLDVLGLLPYFGDTLVCSEQHGAAKPASSIFVAGCTSLGLQPHEVAYVGDKYALDAVGAHEAGLHAYWLDRANISARTAVGSGIRVIRSLDELPAALTG